MATEKNIEKTAATKLWDQIKDITLDIFGLPNQTIKDHAKREEGMDNAFPNDIYMVLRSPAAYPAIEEALANATYRGQVKLAKNERFDLSKSAKYTVLKIVSRD
jgi:hypothetical protein